MPAYFLQKGAENNRRTSIKSRPSSPNFRAALPAPWVGLSEDPAIRWWGVGHTHALPSAGDVAIFYDRPTSSITDVLVVAEDPINNPTLAGAMGWENSEKFPYVFPLRLVDPKEWRQTPAITLILSKHALNMKTWVKLKEEESPVLGSLLSTPGELRHGELKETESAPDFILEHLVAGRNVILYGPPGSGKTSRVLRVFAELGYGKHFETGNPEWTTFDAIGLTELSSSFRPGFFTEAISECYDSLESRGVPTWLVVDEINRTNIDLVLGRAFSLLDLSHRTSTPLLGKWEVTQLPRDHPARRYVKESGLFIPLSFRVLATMNSYDRTLLFKLGYALQRRFAVVPWNRNSTTSAAAQELRLDDVGEWRNSADEEQALKQAILELSLPGVTTVDSCTLGKGSQRNLSEMRQSLEARDDRLDGLSLVEYAFGILGHLDSALEKVRVEHIGVQTAQYVDVARFLFASKLTDSQAHPVRVVDEAISAYVLPQIDVLGRYVRSAKLGLHLDAGEETSRQLELFCDLANRAGLTSRTVPALQRLLAGQTGL